MNKVVTINLGGTAYQLEEGGYDTLRAYLEAATARLQGNPDREEILSDIEWAIGEKFRALLNVHKTVVITKEVAAVLAEMGPIAAEPGQPAGADSGANPGATGAASGAGPSSAGAAGTAGGGRSPKRLYRIPEGAMIAGVCNGLAAYTNVDPTFLRLGFVLLTILWGTGLLVYIVLALVVPEAHTPEEKAAASGALPTAEEFIRRAKEGYYGALKGFPDRQTRRAWKLRFKWGMRSHADQWRYNWHRYWAEHNPVHPGMIIMLPLFSVLHGALCVLWVCALVSLLATGSVLGVALPASVPVWVAAVLLMIIYGLVAGPLKIVRHLSRWSMGQSRPAWSFVYLVDALVWLLVAVVLGWLGWHYLPELREAVQSVPGLIHQATADVQAWWKQQ